MKKEFNNSRVCRELLIFVLLHFLNVNSTFHFKSLQNRRFVILLSASQFFTTPVFFQIFFEFLQRFFNVFASFTGTTIMFLKLSMLLLNYFAVNLRRKITHTFFIYKTFQRFYSKSTSDKIKPPFLYHFYFFVMLV